MKQFWQKWSAKFNSLSLRERGVIFVMVAVVMTALLDLFFLGPLTEKEQAVSQQLAQIDQEMQSLQAEMDKLTNAVADDPNATMKARLADVKKQLHEINGFLQDKQRQLISPNEITRVLEAILIQNRKLQLVSLSNLPMEPLVEMTRQADQTDSSGLAMPETAAEQIYRHGVEIIVQGSYFDLLNYLDELEKIPARMYWDRVSLNVDEHPLAILKLTVYTLSLDETWLKV